MLSVEMTSILPRAAPRRPASASRCASRGHSCAPARRRARPAGRRASSASRSISSNSESRYWIALARHHLELADLLRRRRPAVRLEDADDDVLPALSAPPALVQHRVRLADAGRGAEVEAELSRAPCAKRLRPAVEREVELEHVHARLAEEAERAAVRVLLDEARTSREVEAALTRDARRLERARSRARCAGRDRTRSGDRVHRRRRRRSPRSYAARRSCTALSSSSFVGPRFEAELDIAS